MAGDQDKRLNITTRKHLKLHYHTLILILIGVFCMYAIFNFEKDIVMFFLILWGLDIVPVLFLHYDYWEVNKGEEYVVLFDRLVRWKKGKRDEILSSDIKEIVIRKSASMDKGGIPFLGIESYYCVDVYLKSGSHLTLTCLLSPKIDLEIQKMKNVPFKRIKWLYNPVKSKVG